MTAAVLAAVFLVAAFLISAGSFVAAFLDRIPFTAFFLCQAAAKAMDLLRHAVLSPDLKQAGIDAELLALWLWLWSAKGGGTNTRRRLKSWAKRFHSARGNAPAGGAA